MAQRKYRRPGPLHESHRCQLLLCLCKTHIRESPHRILGVSCEGTELPAEAPGCRPSIERAAVLQPTDTKPCRRGVSWSHSAWRQIFAIHSQNPTWLREALAVRFGSQADILTQFVRPAAIRGEAAPQLAPWRASQNGQKRTFANPQKYISSSPPLVIIDVVSSIASTWRTT